MVTTNLATNSDKFALLIIIARPGRGTGAKIASRLSVVFLVFSVNAGKTKDIPKLVGQLPSAAPSFNCKLHRFNMREKTHD